MKNNTTGALTRRHFIQGLSLLSAGIALLPQNVFGETRQPIKHAIPSSGERIPVIGMGTSRTFDVGKNSAILTQLGQVLQVFFDSGGRHCAFSQLEVSVPGSGAHPARYRSLSH